MIACITLAAETGNLDVEMGDGFLIKNKNSRQLFCTGINGCRQVCIIK